MDQVDGVLDRLQDRLAEQERELAALRATMGQPAAATPEPRAALVAEPPAELAAEPPAEESVELAAEQPTESRAGESRG
jgi:hypothetical protein